jgi:hypothetical protein
VALSQSPYSPMSFAQTAEHIPAYGVGLFLALDQGVVI